VSRFPLGQPVTIPITVQQRNTDGTYSLADAGALTIVVKLQAADGTLTTTGTYNSPAHDGLGKYHQDVPAADLTALGHYVWVATSTGTGAGVVPGDFDVFDPFELTAADLNYCTPEELKARLQITTTADDDQIDLAVGAASRAVDGFCGRYFYHATATRTYVPQDLYRCKVNDLVSVTTLATDPAGNTAQGGTFPVTWPAAAFQLLPYNPGQVGEPWPYTSVKAVGGLTFPWVTPLLLMRMDRVQVTGVFGWPAIPQVVRTVTLTVASEVFRMKDVPGGSSVPGEFAVAVIEATPLLREALNTYRRYPFMAT
jgi:hypothetical protein